MSSDSDDKKSIDFVFWFLELVALACVLVAVEGRFATGQVVSGINWLGAGLAIGLVGFNWRGIARPLQRARHSAPMAFILISALIGALLFGIGAYFLPKQEPVRPNVSVLPGLTELEVGKPIRATL